MIATTPRTPMEAVRTVQFHVRRLIAEGESYVSAVRLVARRYGLTVEQVHRTFIRST